MTQDIDAAYRAMLDGVPAKASISTAAEGDESKRPLEVFFLPPSAFSDDSPAKPNGPVEMGMRLVSELTGDTAMKMALSAAWLERDEFQEEPQRTQFVTSEIMTNVLARSLTDPRDRTKLYFHAAPEGQCRAALSSGGVAALWERLERLRIKHSPLSPEISDDQVAQLVSILSSGGLRSLSEPLQKRLRRLLHVVLADLLAGVEDADTTPEG